LEASPQTPLPGERGLKRESLTPNPSPGGEGLKELIIN